MLVYAAMPLLSLLSLLLSAYSVVQTESSQIMRALPTPNLINTSLFSKGGWFNILQLVTLTLQSRLTLRWRARCEMLAGTSLCMNQDMSYGRSAVEMGLGRPQEEEMEIMIIVWNLSGDTDPTLYFLPSWQQRPQSHATFQYGQ